MTAFFVILALFFKSGMKNAAYYGMPQLSARIHLFY